MKGLQDVEKGIDRKKD